MGAPYHVSAAKVAPGPDGLPNQIFLQVDQALQVAVGKKGDYVELTAQQYAAYECEVQGAVKQAIENTTKALGGRITENGIGRITVIQNSSRR
jgi:hypothetical protein